MKSKPITFDVKTVARMIKRGLVQTYAAIERGDMVAEPESRPMRIPAEDVYRFMENMPRRGPKGVRDGSKPKQRK